MDKVKIGLAFVKKYHFWFLCGLILLVGLATWAEATSDMAKHFDQRQKKLQDLHAKVRSIAGEPQHPNEAFIKKISQLHEGDEDLRKEGKICLKEVVYDAWKRLHEQQVRDNPLPTVLSPDFKEEFDRRLGPIENFPNGEMAMRYRDEYMNRIKEHFPKLFQMIDRHEEVPDDAAKPSDKSKRPAVRPFGPVPGERRPDVNVKWKGVVDWDKSDADRTLDRFQRWRTTPSTLDVLMAQEDLWVYEAILRVIQRTNSVGKDPAKYEAPPRKQAAIKRIMAMEIGQEAGQSWVRLESRSGAGQGPGGGPMTGPPGGGAGGHGARGVPPGPRGAMAGDTRTAAADSTSLLTGRYVDDNGQPLADPTKQPFAEFRMMPVNIRIVIEQKAIPKFLAQCANSNMPIGIRTFRMLLSEGTAIDVVTAAAEGGKGMAGPGAVPAGGAMRRPGGGEIPGATGRAEKAIDVEQEEWADRSVPPVPVEVQGIIYIYNPPDLSKVGTGTAGGGPAAAGPEAAPPAKPTPTPVTPTPTPVTPTPTPVTPPGPAPGMTPGPPVAPKPGVPGPPPGLPPAGPAVPAVKPPATPAGAGPAGVAPPTATKGVQP